jgi:hypothetical protein
LIGDIRLVRLKDHAPLFFQDPNKDQAAVVLGRKAGLKGGIAGAVSMSPKQRAETAAKVRWS